MTGARARRWPVHPPPQPGEALSSWLRRLAARYQLTVAQLLTHNLGPASALVGQAREDDLDWDPPLPVLEALAERTGAEVAELRLATIAGWVPWLLDTLDPVDGSEAFQTYVRQDSVLLPSGRAGVNVVKAWRPWLPARTKSWRLPLSVCPTCAHAPDRRVPLVAGIGLLSGCPEHRCRLEPRGPVDLGLVIGEPVPARPAPEAVVALDRLTWEGLTTGYVALPARPVHVGVWLRLLHTVLDEVSLSAARLGTKAAAHMERIWKTAGYQPRGGLNLWRPYEQLDAAVQEAMRAAAAAALHQVTDGTIPADGSLGHLLTRPRHVRVYDGDQPSTAELERRVKEQARHQSWVKAQQDMEAWFNTARTDPATARQIFGIFTHYCRTREAYEWERDFMIGQGVPAAFLPDPEPGRFPASSGVR